MTEQDKRKPLSDEMTPDEVSVMLRTTSATVREAIRAGRLPAEKRSGTWRVRRSDIEELLARTSNRPETRAPTVP